LTGEHPPELPQKRLKMDVHSLVNVSYKFRHWLDRLIEPNHQNRLPSAQVALELLEGKRKLKDYPLLQFTKPINSSISLVKTTDKLVFTIPSALSRKIFNYTLALLMIGSYTILLLIWLLILSSVEPGVRIMWFFYLFIFLAQIFWSINEKGGWTRIIMPFVPLFLFITFRIAFWLLYFITALTVSPPYFITVFWLLYFITAFLPLYFIFKYKNFSKTEFWQFCFQGFKFFSLFFAFMVGFTPSDHMNNFIGLAILNSGDRMNNSIGLAIFILLIEYFWGRSLRNLAREFCLDTRLEIYANQEIKIQQKSRVSLLEERCISKQNSLKMIQYNFCRLLTKRERQWLIQEIKLFQQNY
jgi:hypothetical protein